MARSVKFLGKLEATLSDQETREGWWEELRDEIKSHARTVCCTHVIGYIETCTIFGELIYSICDFLLIVYYIIYYLFPNHCMILQRSRHLFYLSPLSVCVALFCIAIYDVYVLRAYPHLHSNMPSHPRIFYVSTSGDVCVLSAVGTAAVVKYLGYPTTVVSTGAGIHGAATENKRASPMGQAGGLGLGLGLTTPGLAAMSLNMSSRGGMKDNGRSDDDDDGYDGLVNDDELEEEGYDDGYDDDEEEVRVDEFGTGVTTVASARRAVSNSSSHARSVGGTLGGHRPLLLRRQSSSNR